jgi:RNA polymerase sigma-70 factor (ECF subfamily)
MSHSRHHSFQTTRWTLIQGIQQDADSELARKSLAEICNRYWFPIYAFVRRGGASPEDAEDLTQSFFAHLLNLKLLDRANADRGRLRSFLLACLKHFLGNQWKREVSQRRGGATRPASFDRLAAEELLQVEQLHSEEETPDAHFDREWAHGVLRQVLQILRANASTPEEKTRLEALLPALSGDPDRHALLQQTGLQESALKVAIHRLRRRYGLILRRVVAESVSDPSEVDSELAHLFSCLRRSI